MPKMKTRKGVAKRFKLSKKGKIKKRHVGIGHLLGKKSRKRKRGLKRPSFLHGSDRKIIRHMLPYA
jgi:large subunit ribosomal protein L35